MWFFHFDIFSFTYIGISVHSWVYGLCNCAVLECDFDRYWICRMLQRIFSKNFCTRITIFVGKSVRKKSSLRGKMSCDIKWKYCQGELWTTLKIEIFFWFSYLNSVIYLQQHINKSCNLERSKMLQNLIGSFEIQYSIWYFEKFTIKLTNSWESKKNIHNQHSSSR